MPRNNWTRDQLIVAFNLYCRTPFGRIHNRNPEIISLAKAIGRTPSALSWKLANFARLDPTITGRNLLGATHGAKLEQEIWDEFNSDWDRLAFESEKLRSQYLKTEAELKIPADFPEGRNRLASVMVRVNQNFFRAAVLAAYDSQCCITGLGLSDLLCASHIIPWREDPKNRTNPRNGLCLNAIHDRAFDRGLIAINPDLRVEVSPTIRKMKSESLDKLIFSYEGSPLKLPKHFQPDPEFLAHHHRTVFRRA